MKGFQKFVYFRKWVRFALWIKYRGGYLQKILVDDSFQSGTRFLKLADNVPQIYGQEHCPRGTS